ncbi:MAG TPA: rhomboid family intramembrane serine protease [Pseudonocardiaceae bacterium]
MWPRRSAAAAVVSAAFTALLYLIELVDATLFAGRLDLFGIEPRSLDGLDGVVFAPLLHADWAHLVANTAPVFVLAFLAMANGLRQWIAVTATIWLVGGLGVWLTAPPGTVTVGASVIVFGWLTFLLARGWFNRAAAQILLGLVLFVVWGGMLWGVLPGADGISWQGHLFGAAGGVLAAWLVARAARPARPAVAPLV